MGFWNVEKIEAIYYCLKMMLNIIQCSDNINHSQPSKQANLNDSKTYVMFSHNLCIWRIPNFGLYRHVKLKEIHTKTKKPIWFFRCLKKPIKWKAKKIKEAVVGEILQLLTNNLNTGSIKYLCWKKNTCIWAIELCDFKMDALRVVIELRIFKFKSEIILVISNRTHSACLFDFEVMRMI